MKEKLFKLIESLGDEHRAVWESFSDGSCTGTIASGKCSEVLEDIKEYYDSLVEIISFEDDGAIIQIYVR